MKNKYFSMAAALLLLAGCSNDDTALNAPDVSYGLKSFSTLNATISDMADTRAYIVDGASKGDKIVKWTTGDYLAVFTNSEEETFGTRFHFSDYDSDGVAHFSSEESVSGDKFFAFYGDEIWRDEEEPNLIHIYMNGFVSNNDNGFYMNAPMFAVSKDNDFAFKPLAGMIHVAVSNTPTLHEIQLVGNNNEGLAGEGVINLNDENPTFRFSGEWVDDELGVYPWRTIEEGEVMNYYFVIPPTTFEKGFKLLIRGADEDEARYGLMKTFSEELVVEAGTVKHFDLVDVKADVEAKYQKNASILRKLYEELDGENWDENYQAGWNGEEDLPFNQWAGVSEENGEIVGINLNGVGLSGDVPAVIGKLKELRYLDMENNEITSIPDEIGNLTKLEQLRFYNNLLTSIPDLSKLVNLSYISFEDNDIEGAIPVELFDLPKLDVLLLNGNRFKGQIDVETQKTETWQRLVEHGNLRIKDQQDGYEVELIGIIQRIELSKHELVLAVDDEVNFTDAVQITVTPSDYHTPYTISAWTGEYYDEEAQEWKTVISFENGRVKALHPGDADIWINAHDAGYARAYCRIRVVDSKVDTTNEEFTGDGEKDWDE